MGCTQLPPPFHWSSALLGLEDMLVLESCHGNPGGHIWEGKTETVASAFTLSPLFGTPLPSLVSTPFAGLALPVLWHHPLQEALPGLSSMPRLAQVTLLLLQDTSDDLMPSPELQATALQVREPGVQRELNKAMHLLAPWLMFQVLPVRSEATECVSLYQAVSD